MAGYYNEGVLVEWDDERDLALLDRYKLWVCDKKQTIRCPTPFSLWMLQQNYDNHGILYGHEYLCVPECKGFDSKIKDGWVYHASLLTTGEERKEREPKFRKRIAPWIEDFGREYRKGVDELMKRYEEFKALEMEKLEDWELRDAFIEWRQLYRRNAELHFVWHLAYCEIYTMFEEACEEYLGIDKHDPLFNDVIAGFDHKLIETDRGLFELGVAAQKVGLEPVFKETPDEEELLSKLGQTEPGKRWLGEFHEFLNEYGWRTIENWDAGNPSWVEKPGRAMKEIKRFMSQAAFAVDEVRPKLVEKKTKAEKEMVSRAPSNKRGMFIKLMKATQWCNLVNEEHVFYCENYGNALGRHVTKEIGKRFAVAGVIDDPQDLYYMLPDEIDLRIIPKSSAKKLVELRKKQHAEFRRAEPEPFIGDVTKFEEIIANSPQLRSTVAPSPRFRPELKADLYGTVSTPGVVEGVVNVIMSEDDFDRFEPGSILVTIETSAVWTPLFNMAKAVVTDVGGTLSHAAIVGREYGVPVISGCIEGTKKLKNGMKVRVDGDQGTIHIIKK